MRVIHKRRISRLRVRRSRYIYANERMTDSCAGRNKRLRVPRWPSAICNIFLCFLCAGTPRFTLGIVSSPPKTKKHKEVDVSNGAYRQSPVENLYPSNVQPELTYGGASGSGPPS